MSRWLDGWALVAALGFCSPACAQATAFPGIGRPATLLEVSAWDIDVRPDFKGLPAGSGSVARGREIWDARCASCHGFFGESHEKSGPLTGGTSVRDIRSGRVARLADPTYPLRSALMKLATVSTLWDYIHRAMPWTQPKSLEAQEVYAVTAYLLHLGGVVADDFVLSDRNMADVQKRMPNRDGMTTRHALWPGAALGGASRPDTHNTACMRRCGGIPVVVSRLPAFALAQHGNLAEQNRLVGPQRGVVTLPGGATDPSP